MQRITGAAGALHGLDDVISGQRTTHMVPIEKSRMAGPGRFRPVHITKEA
ncbi:MAG: hypothetical protein Q8K21_07340 [Hydrogenophaga sp.]|nr:hypothetical protein [Hydrogenophaga sp.]MDP2164019.1 hypothetical protein [Hydrogenophaga sp.]MDP3477735.1 hypothetical protein [Hydrogenophaga sp.]